MKSHPISRPRSMLAAATRAIAFASALSVFTALHASTPPPPPKDLVHSNSPAASSRTAPNWDAHYETTRNWWSLQPLRKTTPPQSQLHQTEHLESPIDQFLAASLERKGLSFSPIADPITLLRRVSLILTGLPPTPEQRAAFLSASALDPAAAYRQTVDRLLASPQFGERWARHWMDVVRFTETHGNEWNYDVPYAWRYRDYLIRAFNQDLPYFQLVREHIAGDLLLRPRWNHAGQFNESLIGTAFYRFGEVNHDSCVQFDIIGYDIVDNQIDTLTKTFQAFTVACARCHDHKMDPVSTRDYHALLGIFRSSRSVQHTLDHPDRHRATLDSLQQLKTQIRRDLTQTWQSDAAHWTSKSFLQLLETPFGKSATNASSPLHLWRIVSTNSSSPHFDPQLWRNATVAHEKLRIENAAFNRAQFTTLADFRNGAPPDWSTRGIGLAQHTPAGGDFTVAHEGNDALKFLLPAGLYTFALSDKLNGALRSPVLARTHAKMSFEVIGGRSSLARIVFNNCQLNYNHQHSIHHDDWSWITIDFPPNTDVLRPYAELLTFWDSPKFPDPLGTLGKDTENQRGPFDEHAKNPRTWWGIRRVVLHNEPATPRDEPRYLDRLFQGDPPHSPEALAARFREIAAAAIDAFAFSQASDDDIRWLDWFRRAGLLSNRAQSSASLAQKIADYRRLESSALPTPIMMPGMADEDDGFSQPLFTRGDHTRAGSSVPRRFVKVLDNESTPSVHFGSGRLAIAERIANPDNPLTTRVWVNRIWQWVYGRGLVPTPDDFGHMGEPPSHPELLDFLAAQFLENGASTKHLIRSLVLSRAFQSQGAPTPSAQEIDPTNLLLSHFSARRGEAELIRDSLLAASDRLDPQLFGPSVHPFREKADTEKRLYIGPLDGLGRRSLYIKFQLMEAPRFLHVFNLPGGKVTQGRRDATNVPAQSLALLNDPFVWNMADVWAHHLVKENHPSLDARIRFMFQKALIRDPLPAELDSFKNAVRAFASVEGADERTLLNDTNAWRETAHALFNLKEFIFIP